MPLCPYTLLAQKLAFTSAHVSEFGNFIRPFLGISAHLLTNKSFDSLLRGSLYWNSRVLMEESWHIFNAKFINICLFWIFLVTISNFWISQILRIIPCSNLNKKREYSCHWNAFNWKVLKYIHLLQNNL